MRVAVICLFTLALLGCASDDAPEDDLEATENAIYDSASQRLRAGNYLGAIERLQQLEARFPFGRYAEQAQLELVFAYYKARRSEEARSAADRFIRLHPTHPNVDYAYYLKGLVAFEQDRGFLSNVVSVDPSTRDPGAARDSFNDFSQLIRRFPNSEYAPDAQKKMKYLRNLLAAAEVNVARYYISRGAHIAAANRGRYVLENFQGAAAVPDALAIMVEAYRRLELFELADQALLVLTSNYPEHESLDEEGNFLLAEDREERKPRRWLQVMTLGIMK